MGYGDIHAILDGTVFFIETSKNIDLQRITWSDYKHHNTLKALVCIAPNSRRRTDKYSQYSSIIWPVWLNGWVFVCELSGCGLESRCSHLNFRFCASFEQGAPWHSGNYRVWIHAETRRWHDNNIQSNAPYRQVLTTQLNHLACLTKWLSVHLRTKWLWVRVPLQSLGEYLMKNYQKAKKNCNIVSKFGAIRPTLPPIL